MTNPKPSDAPKRKVGFLVCDDCKRTLPYSGFGDPDLDMGWPMHRCDKWEIKPFTRWSDTDINRVPLAAQVIESLINE